MFQIKNIGMKISELRKEKNITQMEIADLMGVSYQAVSNWERGNSMPDISKLPELAEILNISIDELLGDGKSLTLVKNVISGTEDEYMLDEKISMSTIAEIAPILKPNQTEKIIDKIVEENEENKIKISFEDIVCIAPFIRTDKVDMLALNLLPKYEIKKLCCLAPFMSKKALDTLASKASFDGKLSELCCLAPFLSKETLNNLVLSAKNGNDRKVLTQLAPFLGKNTLNQLVDNFIATLGIDEKTPNIANELFENTEDDYIVDEKISIDELHNIAPHLSEEAICSIAKKALKSNNVASIVALAPHMDDDDLGDLSIEAAKSDQIDLINKLAPYLEEDYLHEIAAILVKKHGVSSIKDIINYL